MDTIMAENSRAEVLPSLFALPRAGAGDDEVRAPDEAATGTDEAGAPTAVEVTTTTVAVDAAATDGVDVVSPTGTEATTPELEGVVADIVQVQLPENDMLKTELV